MRGQVLVEAGARGSQGVDRLLTCSFEEAVAALEERRPPRFRG